MTNNHFYHFSICNFQSIADGRWEMGIGNGKSTVEEWLLGSGERLALPGPKAAVVQAIMASNNTHVIRVSSLTMD
jgi:hypothetical protein